MRTCGCLKPSADQLIHRYFWCKGLVREGISGLDMTRCFGLEARKCLGIPLTIRGIYGYGRSSLLFEIGHSCGVHGDMMNHVQRQRNDHKQAYDSAWQRKEPF
jgi:hypothetical protein